MRAELPKCVGKTGDRSARGATASSSSPSSPYEFLVSSIIRPEEMLLSRATFSSQVAVRVFVALGIEDQNRNPDPAQDHIRSYRAPIICVMHDPRALRGIGGITLLLRDVALAQASREFEPDHIPKLQNGQGARRTWPA